MPVSTTRDVTKFPTATHPLTDVEIEERYGAIIEDFLTALRLDPFRTMTDMFEKGAKHRGRRKVA